MGRLAHRLGTGVERRKGGVVRPGVTSGLDLPSHPQISLHRCTQPRRVFLGKEAPLWVCMLNAYKAQLCGGRCLSSCTPPSRQPQLWCPARQRHTVPWSTTDYACSSDGTKLPAAIQWCLARWGDKVSVPQLIHLDLRGLAFQLRPQRELTHLLIFLQIYSYGKSNLDQKHYILKAVITDNYYHSITPWV